METRYDARRIMTWCGQRFKMPVRTWLAHCGVHDATSLDGVYWLNVEQANQCRHATDRSAQCTKGVQSETQ